MQPSLTPIKSLNESYGVEIVNRGITPHSQYVSLAYAFIYLEGVLVIHLDCGTGVIYFVCI